MEAELVSSGAAIKCTFPSVAPRTKKSPKVCLTRKLKRKRKRKRQILTSKGVRSVELKILTSKGVRSVELKILCNPEGMFFAKIVVQKALADKQIPKSIFRVHLIHARDNTLMAYR